MSTYGEKVDATTLRFERILPGPIEKVWEYLTDGDKRGLWFAGGLTDLTPGGKMELTFRNAQLSSPPDPTPEKYKEFGDGFVSQAKVLVCEAPRIFEIEWEGVVRFELETVGDRVKLVLTHSKLNEGKDTMVGTLAGWHTHLNILGDQLGGQAPLGFWSVHLSMEIEYEQRLA